MKRRKGFVSNSSSSSFIIGEEIVEPLLKKAMEAVQEFENFRIPIKEVAREMLLASGRSNHIPNLDKLPEDVKLIVFNSFNYETEIMSLDDGKAVILTCNNEQSSWDLALNKIEDRFNMSYRSIEENKTYDEIVYEHPCYGGDNNELIAELDEDFEVYFTFNMAEFAEKYGPAAYINEKGVVLYEGKKRICIK